MGRRSSWAGGGTQGAETSTTARRRWSAAAAAVSAASPFAALPKASAFAHHTDVGLSRAVYRESRKVLAKRMHLRVGRRWKLKDVCQAVLEGAKVAMRMWRIVEILQSEVAEGRARREAEAEAKEAAAAKAEAEAAAEAKAKEMNAGGDGQGAAAEKVAAAENGQQSTVMQNITQVVDQVRYLGTPVNSSCIDEIMKLCKDISSSLTRFADMMNSGLEGLHDVSLTLDNHAQSLAGLVGRLKDEMVRLHAALQVAAEMQQDALDRESWESAVAERRAELQATVNSRRELRKAWQQQHKDSKERQEMEEQLLEGKEVQDSPSRHRSTVRKRTLTQSEQVINQLDQLEQALLNSPAAVARRGVVSFGFQSAESPGTGPLGKTQSSEGGISALESSIEDAAESEVKTERSSQTIKEPTNSIVREDSLPIDRHEEKRRPSHSTASESAGKVRSASLPPEDQRLPSKSSEQRQHGVTCVDDTGRPSSSVGSTSDGAGRAFVTNSMHSEGSPALEGRSGSQSSIELDEPEETSRAKHPAKAIQWANSLVDEPKQSKENSDKARYASAGEKLPTPASRQNAAGRTSFSMAAVQSGHWRRIRTPPPVEGNEEKPAGSRPGSPISTQTLASLRAGATARRPSVPDATPALVSRTPVERAASSAESRSLPPESRQPQSARPQVGVVDLFSVSNSRSRAPGGINNASAQESVPPMTARAGCPPRPPGEQRRRYSTEAAPLSARQPKRPVANPNTPRHVESQRSPSPEFDTVWKEAWNPELGAIGRAQRLQSEAWEDEIPERPRRLSTESSGPPQTVPLGVSASNYHSNHSAPGPSSRLQPAMSPVPRVLPPVAGAAVDSRRVKDSSRTAKQADPHSKRQAGAASSKASMVRRHSLGDRGTK